MNLARKNPSTVTRALLVGALVVLALPAVAFAGTEEMQPAFENPVGDQEALRPDCQITQDAAEATRPEPALASPHAVQGQPMVAGQSSTTSGLVYNPCYQFDNPQTGCYYSWRPSDLCCITPAPWCPDICY